MGGGVNPDTHEYVDLGLSVKWATCNIGANTPEEAGLYFAWGDTSGYTKEQVGTVKHFAPDGDNADYKYGTYNESDEENYGMTKYNGTDGKTELDAEDDAATANWGSDWRMPTQKEFDELISSANTNTIFTVQNGVSGLLVTSKINGNSVFFPAAGSAAYGEVDDVGGNGNYWSASLNDEYVVDAWQLFFEEYFDEDHRNYTMNSNYRGYGYFVRPVHKSQ